MTSKQNYTALFQRIENDYRLAITGPDTDMFAVYDPDTLQRAEEIEAPGVLYIIRIEELGLIP